MNSERNISKTEAIEELSKWGVGLGVVIVALFPLSIPILILTAFALIPLAVPVVAVALLILPVLVARRIARSVRRRRKSPPGRVWTEAAPTGS